MKKLISAMLLTLGVWSCTEIKEEVFINELEPSDTKMVIYNHSKDSVLVYVTLGATPGCIQNVSLIPFITDTIQGQRGLQGTFVLAPGDSTIAYAPDSLGYNGVISFNHAPDNCPAPSYTNGLNQFEFILNNFFQGPGAQETIDISCVHGVNCVIRVNLTGKNDWNAGPSIVSVQSFANTMNKNQIGIAGVYPFGCDTCTGSKTPPSCIPLPQPHQREAICNVQRDAVMSGGLVKVIYLGKVEILK
jgi:hypothetical protein